VWGLGHEAVKDIEDFETMRQWDFEKDLGVELEVRSFKFSIILVLNCLKGLPYRVAVPSL
jgi:hypothetical protein